jgi:hypothetical protein
MMLTLLLRKGRFAVRNKLFHLNRTPAMHSSINRLLSLLITTLSTLAIYTLTKADGNKVIQERARTNAVNRKYSIQYVPTLAYR